MGLKEVEKRKSRTDTGLQQDNRKVGNGYKEGQAEITGLRRRAKEESASIRGKMKQRRGARKPEKNCGWESHHV